MSKQMKIYRVRVDTENDTWGDSVRASSPEQAIKRAKAYALALHPDAEFIQCEVVDYEDCDQSA